MNIPTPKEDCKGQPLTSTKMQISSYAIQIKDIPIPTRVSVIHSNRIQLIKFESNK